MSREYRARPRPQQLRKLMRVVGCLSGLASVPVPSANGQVGDFDIRDPLGFEPLILDSQRGHFIAFAAVAASLLLSDAGDPADTSRTGIRAGSWVLVNHGAFFRGYGEHATSIFAGSLGGAYFLRDWLAVGMELYATRLRDGRLDGGGTGAVGSLVFARWYPLHGRRLAAYFEWGTGLLVSDDRFPPRGTKTNFTPAYGAGMTLRVSPHLDLEVGARHLHISNGGLIAGGEREPFDSNGVYVGYQYRF